MNKSVNSTRNPSVKAFDPVDDGDEREMIFAWDNDKLMVRPNHMRCPSCNHALPGDDSDAPNCRNMRCESCGYSVKLYGYNDLSYDKTVDDADYTDADVYDTDREHPNVYSGRFVKGIVLTRPRRGVKFSQDEQVLGPSEDAERDGVDHPEQETVEHMDNSSDTSITGTTIAAYVCSMICMFLIAFCIAYLRGEHKHKDGRVNISLLLCIFFFPQMYFGYALLDWLTSPNHGC